MPIAFFPDMTASEASRAEAVISKSLEVIPTAENRAKYREEAAEYSLAMTRYLDNPTPQHLMELASEQADVLLTAWKSMQDIPDLQELTYQAFEEKIERLYWLTVRRQEEKGMAASE